MASSPYLPDQALVPSLDHPIGSDPASSSTFFYDHFGLHKVANYVSLTEREQNNWSKFKAPS